MKKKSLKFNPDGKFKIMVISDLHERPSKGDKKIADKTEDALLLIEASVKSLNPDLVVFNGDTAFGDTPDEVAETIEAVTKTVRERDIPFAVVSGNHEHDENRVDVSQVMKMFAQYDNCLFRDDKAGITGCGNYYITLKGKGAKTKFNLWFLDSGASNSSNSDISDYDWVHDDQIEWYEQTSAMLAEKNDGNPVPAIVFQHMPVTEIYKLLREAKPKEMATAIKGHGMFSNKTYLLKDGVKGNLGEGPCCPDYNNGQFESWKKAGDVKGAFFGHDHLNDFEGEIDGILLAQCKGSGFNTYSDGDRTGIKLITLKENELPDFKTADYYFKDFGLESKSVAAIDKKFTRKQKENLSTLTKIGVGVAAVTATAVAVSKLKKKKKK